MADLDSLSIQIEADGKKAQDAIGRLESSLSGLAGLLRGLKVDCHISKDLASIASNTREIANAMRGLDSSAFNGVSKGAQKVASETKVAQKAVKELADTTGQVKGVNFISSDSAIQNLVRIKSEYETLIRSMKSGKTSFDIDAFNNAVIGAELAKTAIKKYEEELRASAAAAREVSDATSGISTALSTIRVPNFTLVNSGASTEFSALRNTIEETGTELVTLEQTANAAGTSLANLWDISRPNFTLGDDYVNGFVMMGDAAENAGTAMVSSGQNMTTALSGVRDDIIDVEARWVEMGDGIRAIDPTNLQDVVSKLKEASLSAEEFRSVMANEGYSASFKSIVSDLQRLREEYSETTEVIQYLEDEQKKIQDILSKPVKADIAIQAKQRFEENAETIARLREEAGMASGKIDELIRKMAALRQSGGAKFNPFGDMIIKLEPVDVSAIASPLKGLAKIAKSGVSAVLAPFKALSNGIERILTRLSRFWGRVMRTFTFMLVRKAITAIIGDISNAMKSLAQFESYIGNRFQQSMSTLITDFRWFGANIVAAFAPIINAVTPIIDVLIDKLVQAITVINQFFAALTGNNVFVKARKVAQSYGAAIDDAGGSAGKAAQRQKKLNDKMKDYLLDFDELNVIKPDEEVDPFDNIGRAGGGSGGKAGAPYEWEEIEIPQEIFDMIEKIKELLGDPFLLGRTISSWLTDALESIPWGRIQKTARGVGEYLADLLNGFITPDLFSAVGHTIAEALNTALHFLDSFGDTFNWKGLGTSVAAGINRFFSDFDFGLLARTINIWAHGLLNAFIEAVSKIDWRLIGEKIGTFLASLDFVGILKKVGKSIWLAINAVFDMYSGMFKAAPLETALLSLGGMVALMKVPAVLKFGKALGTLGKNITSLIAPLKMGGAGLTVVGTNALASSKAFRTLAIAGGEVVSGLRSKVGIFRSVGEGLNVIRTTITPTTKALGSLVAVFAEFALVKNIVRDITEGTGSLAGNIAKLVGVIGLASAALYTFLGPAGLVVAAITGVVAAVVGYNQAVEEMKSEALAKGFDSIVASTEGAGHSLHDFRLSMEATADTVTTGLDKVMSHFDNLDQIKEKIAPVITDISSIALAMGATGSATECEINNLIESFGNLKEAVKQAVDEQYNALVAQEMAHYNYVVKTEGYSDELKQQTGERIAALFEERDSVKESLETQMGSFDELSAKTKEIADEFGTDSAEYKEHMMAMSASVLDAIPIMSNLGLVGDEIGSKISDASSKVGEFRSGLDLASENIYNGTDLTTRLSDAVGHMTNTYNESLATLDAERERLNALGKSGEASSAAVARGMADIDARTAELKSSMSSHLEGIQQDILYIIPQAVDELSKKWDDNATIENGFMGFKNKDEYIKSNLENFVNEVYGKGGMGEILDSTMKETGLEFSRVGKEEMINAIDGMFDSEVVGSFSQLLADGSQEWVVETTPVLKENFTQMFDDAVAQLDLAPAAIDTMKGYNDALRDEIPKTADEFNNFGAEYVESPLRNSLESESPSQLTYRIGEDTILGYTNAIDDGLVNVETSITSLSDTITNGLEGIKESMSVSFDGVGDSIVESFSGIDESVSETMSGVSSAVTSSLGSAKANAVTASNGIVAAVSTSLNKLNSATTARFNAVKTTVTTSMNAVSSVIKNQWNQISMTQTTVLRNMSSSVTNQFNAIKRIVTTANTEILSDTQIKWKQIENVYITTLRNIGSGVTERFESIKRTITATHASILTDTTSTWGRVENAYRVSLGNIESSVATSMRNVKNSIDSTINSLRAAFDTEFKIKVKVPVFNMSGKFDPETGTVPKITILRWDSYATGGFPEDGLFFANSSELVGRFANGKTAVANNEQIVAGIQRGVEDAVAHALVPYLSSIDRHTAETANKDSSIYLDGRELVSSIEERQRRNGWAFQGA